MNGRKTVTVFLVVETHFYKGVCYLSLLQFDKAINEFDECIKLNSSYSEAYFNKGICLMKKEKSDEAIYEFEKAIKLKKSSVYYETFGNVLTKLGRVEEAKIQFEKMKEV